MIRINFNDMLYAFSYGLDCVEHELLGVTTNHGKRVAYFSVLMGRTLGVEEEIITDLVACAVLHDNALTEYIHSEYIRGVDVINDKQHYQAKDHCVLGEKNMSYLALCMQAKGAVLYHHENADGSGPFGKKSGETPLFAQIIHMANQIDAKWDLSAVDEDKYEKLVAYIKTNEGVLFSLECVEAFLKSINYKKLSNLKLENIEEFLQKEIPQKEKTYSGEELIAFATLFGNIIDYKSKFTRFHSMGIAKKAAVLSEYYGFDENTRNKMFFAGAVHDVGKLVVDKEILEKPDKLTEAEYKNIQNHAYYTYEILRKIKGMEDITQWASLHHEKLNGKGYPFGKTGDELGFKERILACLDIYQALVEDRPYKSGMSHGDAMKILMEMVEKGGIDRQITLDIDKVFAKHGN